MQTRQLRGPSKRFTQHNELIHDKKMTFEEIVHHRRSVRHYKDLSIDPEKVKHCIELATLSPNSSNMQLWEFYHITSPETLKELSVACLNQESATTAQQMVVFVTRRDLYKKKSSQHD